MSDRDRKKKERRAKRKARRAPRGLNDASIAQYGPDDKTVTKVAVAIIGEHSSKPVTLRRWVASDVTTSPIIRQEIFDFLKENDVGRIIFTTGVIGCIHEEGKDYRSGEECPFCPFWRGRDRWAKAQPLIMTLGRFRDRPPW